MAGFDIDFHGLDSDLDKVTTAYPDETASFMRKEANKWKKDCNDKGYGKYTGGKRPIPKSWKTTKEENILHQVNAVEIQNKSPLFHLLENGHRKWFMGHDTGGYVPGKHWAEQTRGEWQTKFGDHVSDYIGKMLGGHGL